jgi:acyl carrier protein
MSYGDDRKNTIVRVLAEQLGVSEDKIREKLDFDGFNELAADSLDVVELVIELEEEFGDDFGSQ